jgi:hypothetical protein
MFLAVECGRCVGLTTLQPPVSRRSMQCGIFNISQPYSPPPPFTGTASLRIRLGHLPKESVQIQGRMQNFVIKLFLERVVSTIATPPPSPKQEVQSPHPTAVSSSLNQTMRRAIRGPLGTVPSHHFFTFQIVQVAMSLEVFSSLQEDGGTGTAEGTRLLLHGVECGNSSGPESSVPSEGANAFRMGTGHDRARGKLRGYDAADLHTRGSNVEDLRL